MKNLFLILAISIGIYFAIKSFLIFEFSHSLSVFIAFGVFPILFLLYKKQKIELGNFDKSFLISFLIYIVFFIWIISYYPKNPKFFSDFSFKIFSIEFFVWNIFIGLNVATVDFFTKRIVQLEFAKNYNEKIAFLAQIIVWMFAHIPEHFWLVELMNPYGSFLFLLTSGTITGLIYSKYKNVIGFMFGHWFLNFLVAIYVSL